MSACGETTINFQTGHDEQKGAASNLAEAAIARITIICNHLRSCTDEGVTLSNVAVEIVKKVCASGFEGQTNLVTNRYAGRYVMPSRDSGRFVFRKYEPATSFIQPIEFQQEWNSVMDGVFASSRDSLSELVDCLNMGAEEAEGVALDKTRQYHKVSTLDFSKQMANYINTNSPGMRSSRRQNLATCAVIAFSPARRTDSII